MEELDVILSAPLKFNTNSFTCHTTQLNNTFSTTDYSRLTLTGNINTSYVLKQLLHVFIYFGHTLFLFLRLTLEFLFLDLLVLTVYCNTLSRGTTILSMIAFILFIIFLRYLLNDLAINGLMFDSLISIYDVLHFLVLFFKLEPLS